MKSKIMKTCQPYSILLAFSFVFVLLFSCTTSPFYDGYPFWFYGDAGVFQQMGLCILNGGTPYVDLFDHKGPILFFIQALGLWINREWGLLILQTINLFSTLVLWKKTIELIDNQIWLHWLILAVSSFFLWMFYQRGDLCEEWSLPFISLPINLYVKRYSQHQTYGYGDTFIVGLCFSIIAFIRLNNVATFLGFLVYYLCVLIYKKQWKRFLLSGMLLLLSLIVVAIPCVLFFYFKAGELGVIEMLYGTFVFNFVYISNGSGMSLIENIRYFIPSVGGLLLVLISMRKEDHSLTIPILLSFLIGILTVGHAHFYHYLMIFVPLFALSFSLLTKYNVRLGYLVVICMVLQSTFAGYSAIDCFAFRVLGKKADTAVNDSFHDFVSTLSDEERGSIWNYNLGTQWPERFAEEDLVQCNRFLTERHIVLLERFIEYSKTHNIKTHHPQWVMIQNVDQINSLDRDYIIGNYQIKYCICHEDGMVGCFKKKCINDINQIQRDTTSFALSNTSNMGYCQ